jgi:hypothetical protein
LRTGSGIQLLGKQAGVKQGLLGIFKLFDCVGYTLGAPLRKGVLNQGPTHLNGGRPTLGVGDAGSKGPIADHLSIPLSHSIFPTAQAKQISYRIIPARYYPVPD